MSGELNILKTKIDGFIRKFYKNQIIKGLIYSASSVLVLFLFVDLVEYFAWTGTFARTTIFYAFVSATIALIFYFILIPGFKLIKIGKIISDEEAARIIGNHFPEVQDKLLNTLQLQKNINEKSDKDQVALLIASIEQKAVSLKPIPFAKAIDLNKNRKHLKYFIPPLLALLLILIIAPAFVTGPSSRLIRHREYFERPLPYSLKVVNEKLEVLQHDDFTLKLEANGEEIPAIIYLNDGNFRYKMTEINAGKYEYIFKDLNSDTYFQIETEDFKSQKYQLTVFPKPVIFSFEIELNYPDYLDVENELISNSGDLIVPEGTTISWKIIARDAENILFKRDHVSRSLVNENENVFSHQEKALKNFNYSLAAENKFVKSADSMSFYVQVIADEYPVITMDAPNNSLMAGFTFINGNIADDHGFHSLDLYYKKENEENWTKENLQMDNSVTKQFFQYSIQPGEMNLNLGESLTYYFEVRDNDEINAYKRSKTANYFIHLPDENELETALDELSDKMKDKMESTLKELAKFEKDLEKMQLSLFEKKDLNWLEKAQIQDLLNHAESLQNEMEQFNLQKEQIDKMDSMLEKEPDAELMEKMSQLQELFEQLANENIEKQFKELRKSLENLDKDKLAKMLEEMKKSNQEQSNNLEQNLELFKQMEFEQKFQEMIDELKALAEKQNELGEKTENKELDTEKSKEEQEKLKEEFSQFEEKMEKASELNEELSEPFPLENDSSAKADINEEMTEATDNLEKGKQGKASQNQKNAGQKMEEMANGLQSMMQSTMNSRMGEDAEQIKKLLDNIMDLSFAEESLMKKIAKTSLNDPLNVEQIGEQKLYQDDFRIVKDSLAEISKRQIYIQPFIIKESASIENYLERAGKSLQENRKGPAMSEQQYAITSLNNLALMLAESLDKMQQSMQSSGEMSGNQKCKNPGSKPGNMDQMLQMQQQLNEGMNKQSKDKGLQGQEGLNGQSEELARMAARQSEIRKMLQQFIDEIESSGGNGQALNKLVEEMQKTEKDIVNRKINQETLNRQKDIEVRLLRSEKAEQEREKDNKRESSEGRNKSRSNQNQETEYKMENTFQTDILIAKPIIMSGFYKDLYKRYIYKIETEDAKP